MAEMAEACASQDLVALVEELDRDPKTPEALKREGRRALANSQFYMTWLLRLEGNAYVWAHGLLRDYLIQRLGASETKRLSALAAGALAVLVGREDVQEERGRHLWNAEGRAREACEAMLDEIGRAHV